MAASPLPPPSPFRSPPSSETGHGRVHLYLGDGKGKTTAAVGLAVRAAGWGHRVAFVQFDKGHDPRQVEHYGERSILRGLPVVEVHAFGRERMNPDGTFRFGNTEEDRAEARRALRTSRDLLRSGRYFLLVCDEILSALSSGTIAEDDIHALLDARDPASAAPDRAAPDTTDSAPASAAPDRAAPDTTDSAPASAAPAFATEIVLTGRLAPPGLIARADLVTEMRAVKHYYERGDKAREGIEY